MRVAACLKTEFFACGTMSHLLSLAAIFVLVGSFHCSSVCAFSIVSTPAAKATGMRALATASGEAAVAEMDDERRASLFQSMLKDLQIENVPLLGCDVNQVHTMSAALWTTISELSEDDDAKKVCFIVEEIPMVALRAFAADFATLQTQHRLIEQMPELKRISVTLLGRGVGPALVIETTARTEEEIAEKATRKAAEAKIDEYNCNAALKAFTDRVVVKLGSCPYTKSPDISAVGLEPRGVLPGPVGYRFNGSSDACSAVASFWDCVCELLTVPETQLSTTLLSLPCIGPGNNRQAHDRFAAVMELISRYLCLFRGDSIFGLVHFHPAYDRTLIHPVDKPSYGHLPPRSWLRSMLRQNGNIEEAESLSDDDLALSDYQRRAPHTMINILRASHLNAAVGAKSIVDLQLEDGRIEKASGISLYSRNTIRLAREGRESLQREVEIDIALERW